MVGKGRQVLIGQTDRPGIDDISSVSRCVPSGLWVSVGEFEQGWAKVGRSGCVRLIGREWVILLVGGCGFACSRSRDGCGQVLADMGKGGQRS